MQGTPTSSDLTGTEVLTTDSSGTLANTRITDAGAGYNSGLRAELTVQQLSSSPRSGDEETPRSDAAPRP
jgi:hypothetical protein